MIGESIERLKVQEADKKQQLADRQVSFTVFARGRQRTLEVALTRPIRAE